MSQEVVKKKAHPADVLTIMQRRFVDYLVYNQGRTTFTDAALAAGYSPNRARIEGSELMDNPKVIKYMRYKVNEVNRSFTVTKNNFVLSSRYYPRHYKTLENQRNVWALRILSVRLQRNT